MVFSLATIEEMLVLAMEISKKQEESLMQPVSQKSRGRKFYAAREAYF
mgnify:CR=1 FL=1